MSEIPQQISYAAWLSLPVKTRAKLAALFDLQKSGDSVVHVGAMINGNISAEQTQDGYTPKDLQVITLERLQEVTGKKSDNFYELFGKIVENIDDYVESDEVPQEFTEADLATAVGAKPAKEITTKNGKNEKPTKAKKKAA